jgi:putative ABC transport system permease protein
MRTLWQDVNFAARMLGKNPGFTCVAVLTLALGIGANSAIFSVVNAVLLRPLPYPDSSRLLFVSAVNQETKTSGVSVSFTKFSQVQEQSRTLERLAAFYPTTSSLVTEGEPETLNAARVSLDFFLVLGVSPARGRNFLPEEEVPGAADVALISDGFWHSHFAADENVLGKALHLDSKAVPIIGILPASFRFPLQFPEPDVWIPRVSEHPLLKPAQIRVGAGYLSVIARLKADETLPRAQAELDAICVRYKEQFGSNADGAKYGLSAARLDESLVGTLRSSLLVLLAAVGFVLLIACANVANLLLARATAREKEIALRKALGASSVRLVRQLLTESLLLSFFGGLLGISVAIGLLPALRSISPGTVPRLAESSVDASVLLFSVLLCGITGLVFGLVPALQAAGKQLHDALKGGIRGSSAGGSRGRSRALLVMAEMALALILMTGAGLLIESFASLMKVNPGFSPRNLMAYPLTLPPDRYSEPRQQAQFYRQLLERVKEIPGVQAAGVVSYLPLSGAIRYSYFCAEGHVCEGLGKDPLMAIRQVSTGYFDAFQTPLLRGRVFNENDLSGGLPVVIVNETAAKHFWPDGNPIGKHITGSRDLIPREVVGVVGDVKFSALNSASSEELYLPSEQMPWPVMTLLVRSTAKPQLLVSAVHARIAELDPHLPVSGISSMTDIVGTSVAQPRLIMEFVGIFAGFALLLSAIGIYGVMAYSVSNRKQEMGIRMSLGATPRDILKLVVGQGMRLVLIGLVVGLVASLALTRLIRTLLFGVPPHDPLTFAAATVTLALTALIACYLPARRATRLDPLVVLRYE